MATQLTIVNNVLRRLREDTVASVADNAYAQLIAMWVNDGMRYVQEAYDWGSLNGRVTVDLVADQEDYDLSATTALGGDVQVGSPVTTNDSMLRFDSANKPLIYVYADQSDDLPDFCPELRTSAEIDDLRGRDRGETAENPTRFALQLQSGGGYQLKLWPTPSAAKWLTISFWTPQADLAIDGTDNATQILVPSAPVEAWVHMTAANERGEEIGEPGNLLERRYHDTLSGAIEAAASVDGRANRYESWRD
jgi:hypothetical protein